MVVVVVMVVEAVVGAVVAVVVVVVVVCLVALRRDCKAEAPMGCEPIGTPTTPCPFGEAVTWGEGGRRRLSERETTSAERCHA